MDKQLLAQLLAQRLGGVAGGVGAGMLMPSSIGEEDFPQLPQEMKPNVYGGDPMMINTMDQSVLTNPPQQVNPKKAMLNKVVIDRVKQARHYDVSGSDNPEMDAVIGDYLLRHK